MKKYLAILLLSFSLIGCTKPVIESQVVQNPVIQPNLPAAANLQNVAIKVYDKKDIAKLPGTNVILYTMTPAEFQKLMQNISEMNRYILQSNDVIVYYISQYTPNQSVTKTK